MVNLVSERSEYDIAVTELGYELAELAAQMMRLAAGGGSIVNWGRALDRAMKLFDQTIDGRPLSIGQFELQNALKFRRPELEVSEIERQIDAIATQALRMVASRIEGNNTQEKLSQGKLMLAARRLDEALEENRKKYFAERPLVIRHAAPRRLKKALPPTSAPLSARMIDALKFIGETDHSVLRGMRRPGMATLQALEARGLIKPGGPTLGYSLTARGEKAREGC